MGKLRFFRLVYLSSHWIRDRMTPAGLVISGLTAFAGAFGLDTQMNLAHMVFSLGLSLLLVDSFWLRWTRHRPITLRAERRLPEFVTAGEPARYRVRVQNTGRRPLPPLRLAEVLQQPWPAAEALRHRAESLAVNRFDARVGYPAFIDLLRRLRALDVEPFALMPLLPGQQQDVEVVAQPNARGLAIFEHMLILRSGPLGLMQTRQSLHVPVASLPVLPTRQPIRVEPASSLRHLQPGGISLAQRVGDAEEFRSLRDYRPGDPLRAIHWRSYARTGQPVVREYQEEFFARHALVLDTAAPYPFAPSFETAVSIAAWLVAQPHDADALLDLLFVGDRVHRLTMGRGLGKADSLLRILATVQPSPPEGIEPLLATLDRNAPQVSSVIAIFLAWDTPRQKAIERLLARGIRPQVFLIEEHPASQDLADSRLAGVVQRLTASQLDAQVVSP